MRKLMLVLIGFIGLNLMMHTASAQQNQVPGSSFNLDELFNFDFNQMMQDLQAEMDDTKSIWEQFIDPGIIDSGMNMMQGLNLGGSVDTIIQQLQQQMGGFDMNNLNSIIDQLFKDFDINGNIMPIMPNTPQGKPEDYNGQEWKVVPNIPKEAPKDKVKPTGTSLI